MFSQDAAAEARPYDVILFDYSAEGICSKYVPAAQPRFQLQHRPRTFKWPAMHAFFSSPAGRQALLAYDYFLLTDDDVDFWGDAEGVHRLFRLCAAADMHLCQPALSGRSAVNFNATAYTAAADGGSGGAEAEASRDLARVRLTGFVEQMSPVFSREALMQFLPYFAGLTHAWGIDALWSDVSDRLGKRVGVADSVVVDHMRPSGVSGLYKRIGGIEKARADQTAFKARFGIRQSVFDAADTLGGGEVVTVPNVAG